MTNERKNEIVNKYKLDIVNSYNEYKRTNNGVWKYQCKCIHNQYKELTGGTMTVKQIVNESKGI